MVARRGGWCIGLRGLMGWCVRGAGRGGLSLDVGCAGGVRGALRVGIAPGGVCGGVARGGGVRARCRTEEAYVSVGMPL